MWNLPDFQLPRTPFPRALQFLPDGNLGEPRLPRLLYRQSCGLDHASGGVPSVIEALAVLVNADVNLCAEVEAVEWPEWREAKMHSKYSSFAAVAFFCALSICSSRAAYAATASDPCSLITQAQVGADLGVTVEAPQRTAPTMCQWSTPVQQNASNAKKVLLIISTERAFEFAKSPISSSEKAIPASGICDDAVYAVASGVDPGPGTSLYVKKGSSYFVVHIYGLPDQTKVMAMEKTLATQACSNL